MQTQRRAHRRLASIFAVAALLVAATTQLILASPSEAAVYGIRGWISSGGAGAEGVTVDLFRAAADGSRAEFLGDTRSDRGGNYSFDVGDGCYVVTMIAPQGRQFTNNSRWFQRQICVSGGHSANPLDGQLTGGGDDGGNDCEAGRANWTLQFEDHFSGNGAALNRAWNTYYSTGNAGYGLRRPHAISQWGGNLNIRAQMENGTLVSGGMSHDHHQTYGRYEFRVRTDQDWSEGTSGVVLTWPQSGVHPRDGENNVYETLATPGDRHEFYTFIHEPYGTVHDQDYTVHHASANDWHTMVMEWTPNWIRIYRDGQLIRLLEETGEDLIPDVPHRLAIQLDAWRHQISSPVWMQVDYVKVWSFDGYQSC